MKTSLVSKVITGLALLSISAPSAIADDNDRQYSYDYSNQHHRYDNSNNWNSNRYSNHSARNWRRNELKSDNWDNTSNDRNTDRNNNNWNWDRHNWNDQKAQLRANCKSSYDNRMSALQQQQLDAQMKAQWLQYHNNNWNGAMYLGSIL